ncbi:MAG: hypothetical protein IJ752_02925 [Alphaproteobacteria bacterium]|nr:hypothetical protein [Alphaproteobacteria bacterium]
MAKEYKFMFDRRFDEPESDEPVANENLSDKSVDGLPSISQLLDTLNKQAQIQSEQDKDIPDQQETEEKQEPAEQKTSETDSVQNEEPPSLAVEQEPLKPTAETPSSAAAIPVFTINQMEAAEKKAREEGRLNGLEEGRETAWQEAMVSIEKQNSDTLSTIDASLKEILQQLEKNAQNAFETAVNFAWAVCQKAVPALCETNALNEIRSLLEKNLHFLKDEPKISLRLNPFLADKIKPVLTELIKKESYGGKIAVVRDDTMPIGDCRVEWKNGGLEKNAQDVLNHTEELLKLYTHAAPADEPSADHTGEKHHG